MKLGVIGHIGANKDFADGQTIKTRELISALCKFTNWKIYKVDTYYKRNPLKLFVYTIICLINCEDIIVLLSRNGLKVYMPLLYFAAKYLNKRIYHDIIGGNDSELIAENPLWIKYMNSFVINWSETYDGINQLNKFGIYNTDILPNFKQLKPINKIQEYKSNQEAYYFCTFSRVCEEKGIEDAIIACDLIAETIDKKIELHIYGHIDEKFKEKFNYLLDKSITATYKGIVSYDKSVDVLASYYMLLFPTKWKSEGMPGTIIDAFAAGCPIIANEWINSCMIEQWKSGVVYPNNKVNTLYEAIVWAIKNDKSVYEMRSNCLKEYNKYTPEKICSVIIDKINNTRLKCKGEGCI